MWLQRVLFNVQRRFLGREEQHSRLRRSSKHVLHHRRSMERVQIIENRLLDLDDRLAQLR